jgi:DNA-binding SARP family transcriptional activator
MIGISEAATQTGTTILDGRLHDIAGDAWTPHILFVDLPDDSDTAGRDHTAPVNDPHPQITSNDRAALAELINDLTSAPTRPGIAVVLAATDPLPIASCEMTITADAMLAIPDVDLQVRACQLTTSEAADLTDLLTVAANLADQPMPDARGDADWDVYADAAGAPQRRLAADITADPRLHPRSAPTADTLSHSEPAGFHQATIEDGDEGRRVHRHRVNGHGDAPPVQTILPLPTEVYLARAATIPSDLDALAPPLPEMTREEITRADTGLDDDLTAWRDPNSSVPKLRLLGPLVLTGVGPAPDGRGALLTELIAYLLTRPRGATVEELASALWPHIPNAASKTTPRQSVSAARHWLGVSDRTHRERLPRATADAGGARLYRITDVLVDAELFRRLRLRGSTRGEAGINDLQAALDLVSGPPFAQRRPGGYSWLADTPLNHEYTAMIVDVAHLVATHHLATGNPDAAASAAQISLSVEAGDDVALLDLLAAAEAHGNDAEARTYLRRILANHDAEIEEDLPPRTFEVLLRRGSIERLNASRGTPKS